MKYKKIRKLLSILFLTIVFSYIFIYFLLNHFTINEVCYRGDAIFYFNIIKENSWNLHYRFEPILGILKFLELSDFRRYLFFSNLFPILLVVFSTYRLKFSLFSIIITIFFFLFSYYGLHFLFNFQRQFYALAFLLLYLSYQSPYNFIFLIMAQLSHIYAFIIIAFVIILKFIKKIYIVVISTILFMLLMNLIIPYVNFGSIQHYLQAASISPDKFTIRSLFQITFTLILFFLNNSFRRSIYIKNIIIFYLLLMTFSLIPSIGALLVRIDYYYFPILIFLTLHYIERFNNCSFKKFMTQIMILCYTIFTGLTWINNNALWIFYGIQ